MRRTKIVATMGPACDTPEVMERLILAGVDLIRLNLSHGSRDGHRKRVALVRELSQRHNRAVALLLDLQGPKIRIGRFVEDAVVLKEGQSFTLDTDLNEHSGNQHQVSVTYKNLAKDVRAEHVLVLDDGRISLKVTEVIGSKIHCSVLVGGKLSSLKGINLQGGGLSAPALTDKDIEDIQLAAEVGADYLAVSFPSCAQDMEHARSLLRQAGGEGALVAKIERAEAIEALDEIIAVSDAIMVARGDLGVEVGDAELPAMQKRIIRQARKLSRAVIVATQMMESMIHQPVPTRAEVFDVANAVYDGTDAVMLSAETATGAFPDKAVQAMGRICAEAEKQRIDRAEDRRFRAPTPRVDQAIAAAAMYTANKLNCKALIALTESGMTALWMSRIESGIPIYGLSGKEQCLRRMALYRGVTPIYFNPGDYDYQQVNQAAITALRESVALAPGDSVVLTKGDHKGVRGGTNSMKILVVSEN